MGDKECITTPHHGFQLCSEDKQARSEDPLGMKVRSAGVLQLVGVIRGVDFSILEGGFILWEVIREANWYTAKSVSR